MAIIAFPAAWVADRTRRDVVLKACGVISLGAHLKASVIRMGT
jgi:hypothetical protein